MIPDCLISIEYKPNEPRSFAVMPDCATTLLAIKPTSTGRTSASRSTSPMCSTPTSSRPFAAALAGSHSRILGIHLNDGYAKRDDGLMVGSVHPLQTIELLRQMRADGYGGAIYFDTFPDTTGPRSRSRMRSEHRDGAPDVRRHGSSRRRQSSCRSHRPAGRRFGPRHCQRTHLWRRLNPSGAEGRRRLTFYLMGGRRL